MSKEKEAIVWEKKLSFMARPADHSLRRPGRPTENRLNISMSKQIAQNWRKCSNTQTVYGRFRSSLRVGE